VLWFHKKELIGTTKNLTLQARCRINSCRYTRVSKYQEISGLGQKRDICLPSFTIVSVPLKVAPFRVLCNGSNVSATAEKATQERTFWYRTLDGKNFPSILSTC
jgi:hypothetical protein